MTPAYERACDDLRHSELRDDEESARVALLAWRRVFHDYKNDGIDRERLETWCTKVGWETLLNRAGTTFRKLSEKDKQALDAARLLH